MWYCTKCRCSSGGKDLEYDCGARSQRTNIHQRITNYKKRANDFEAPSNAYMSTIELRSIYSSAATSLEHDFGTTTAVSTVPTQEPSSGRRSPDTPPWRCATLNVGTANGLGELIASTLKDYHVDVCALQEVRLWGKPLKRFKEILAIAGYNLYASMMHQKRRVLSAIAVRKGLDIGPLRTTGTEHDSWPQEDRERITILSGGTRRPHDQTVFVGICGHHVIANKRPLFDRVANFVGELGSKAVIQGDWNTTPYEPALASV